MAIPNVEGVSMERADPRPGVDLDFMPVELLPPRGKIPFPAGVFKALLCSLLALAFA